MLLRPDAVIFFIGQGLMTFLQVFCIVLCLAVTHMSDNWIFPERCVILIFWEQKYFSGGIS